jgi:chemotaxis protein CheD
MINEAMANKNALKAKIFGGAKMFTVNSDLFDIGKSNIVETKNILERIGIRLVSSRLGGTKGHQISLDTETGIVQSKIFGEKTEEY